MNGDLDLRIENASLAATLAAVREQIEWSLSHPIDDKMDGYERGWHVGFCVACETISAIVNPKEPEE